MSDAPRSAKSLQDFDTDAFYEEIRSREVYTQEGETIEVRKAWTATITDYGAVMAPYGHFAKAENCVLSLKSEIIKRCWRESGNAEFSLGGDGKPIEINRLFSAMPEECKMQHATCGTGCVADPKTAPAWFQSCLDIVRL